ncbi:MAG: DUF1828 domain-containing protein [Ignavibacteriales bacterium]|nr:DUF1828 domain-containing protein [Ignavibacteriales bacterium]
MKDLIQSYIDWLRQKINYKEVNGYYEISTPFVNHINDYIQIYLKRDANDRIVITDDGDTIKNLEMEGLEFNTPSRKKELEVILNGFGISVSGNELLSYATPQTFPMRKHNFIQAILAVDDLHVLAQPKVESYFIEDVVNYLNHNSVRFSRNIILQGKSTFQHKFDILIPASQKETERILKIVVNPKKQNIISHLFGFEDTKLARDNEGIMVLNDIDKEIPVDVIQAIKEYGIYDIPWSQREKHKFKLVA